MSGVRKFAKIAMNLDAWTVAYVGGMTTKPTSAHIQLIDKFVKTTKSILSAKADVFYLGNINNSNDSFRNLVKNAHHGTIQGSDLVWDNLVGFTNPHGTGWVDTNYNPATQGIKYTLNDAGIGVNLFNANSSIGKYILGCVDRNYTYLYNCRAAAINSTSSNYWDFQGSVDPPFRDGMTSINRTSSSSVNNKNQNIPTYVSSKNSSGIPRTNIRLFNRGGLVSENYIGGLNCVYIGASLTDAEYATLNTAINEYLIGCLFLKYGGDANWGVKMAKSYFYDLHGFEKYEAFEVYEFIKRHQPDYTYTPPELSINSGAPGLTDWVDSNADGVADNWSVTAATNYVSIGSIVMGNGFTGNAQRAIENNVNDRAYIGSPHLLVVGKTYVIGGKYRCLTKLNLANALSSKFFTLNSNTGNAISFSVTYTSTVNGLLYFVSDVLSGSWMEIDEISVKEVTESDTVNFNKCLNAGFGLATDFVDTDGDGLADGWELLYSNIATSIVTGNGFVKKAQRLERLISSGNIICVPYQLPLTIGKSYTIYCKYRSNIGITLYPSTGGAYNTLPINTENAIYGSFTFVATDLGYGIGASSQNVGSWFEISEVLVIDNSNSQFNYNVFGPNGLNIQISNHVMLFKAGGNLIANTWTKSGALLRWNQDGGIANSNTMPAYTRSNNLGIVTVTSTDGWNGVTNLVVSQSVSSVNSYYGNMPKFFNTLKNLGIKSRFQIYYNRFKIDLRNQQLSTLADSLYNTNNTDPGGIKVNISDLVSGNYSSFIVIAGDKASAWSKVYGDVTSFTNEFSYVSISMDDAIYGSLKNLIITNLLTYINFQQTNVSEGTSVWNRNVSTFTLQSSKLSTSEVDAQLKVINDYFAINTPIKNVTINLSGASMGIPTGGANNTDLLGIIAKHVAAGFVATISVRTV